MTVLHRVEDGVMVVCLAAMALLPAFEVATRGRNLPSMILIVQYLTLWLGLLGAALATREDRHIGITAISDRLTGRWAQVARVIAATAATSVAAILAYASGQFVSVLREGHEGVFQVPEWIWGLALPIGFGLIALRRLLGKGLEGWSERGATIALTVLVCSICLLDEERRSGLLWPLIAALGGASLLGAPLYALIGGSALLLFMADFTPIASVPNAAYGLVVSPMLPTIPLFTLAGYVFAEGGASKRLVGLFRELFGWMPGGLAVAAAIVCAFFTAFTGGSGVTILALGGLLLPAMVEAGYTERYSVGLLTSAGSLGLLFPPSIPVILYGVVAETRIDHLFAGALVPGLLLVGAVAATGVYGSRRGAYRSGGLNPGRALDAMWQAKWEMLLPVIVFGGLFGGFTTPVEAASITALYAIFVEVVVHRDLTPMRGLATVMVKTAILIGGVFTILGVALGLTSYLVDAQVPAAAVEWVQQGIETRLGFLLALNVFLLVVGCLMDIFSAIVVVVPIITPIAAAYGVDPVHLGVIFIANLELGYLTPPVGLNLFLASFRFEKPLHDIYRSTIPFFLILLVVVIAITYVPALTQLGLRLLGKSTP